MSQLVTINLSKQPGASWGFRLQGGKDFAQPLGIQKVNVGSVAEQAGVRVGDSIVSIGGTDALSLRHKEAQDAIVKAGNSFQLVVQRGSSLWKPKVTPLPQPTKTPQGPVATQTSLAKSQATKINNIGSCHNTSPRPYPGPGTWATSPVLPHPSSSIHSLHPRGPTESTPQSAFNKTNLYSDPNDSQFLSRGRVSVKCGISSDGISSSSEHILGQPGGDSTDGSFRATFGSSNQLSKSTSNTWRSPTSRLNSSRDNLSDIHHASFVIGNDNVDDRSASPPFPPPPPPLQSARSDSSTGVVSPMRSPSPGGGNFQGHNSSFSNRSPSPYHANCFSSRTPRSLSPSCSIPSMPSTGSLANVGVVGSPPYVSSMTGAMRSQALDPVSDIEKDGSLKIEGADIALDKENARNFLQMQLDRERAKELYVKSLSFDSNTVNGERETNGQAVNSKVRKSSYGSPLHNRSHSIAVDNALINAGIKNYFANKSTENLYTKSSSVDKISGKREDAAGPHSGRRSSKVSDNIKLFDGGRRHSSFTPPQSAGKFNFKSHTLDRSPRTTTTTPPPTHSGAGRYSKHGDAAKRGTNRWGGGEGHLRKTPFSGSCSNLSYSSDEKFNTDGGSNCNVPWRNHFSELRRRSVSAMAAETPPYRGAASEMGMGTKVNGTPIVNPQYNSPINLYNEDSIAEALSAQSEVLGKGCLGVNFMKNDPRTGAADKESDVLKMVQEMDRAPKTPPVSSGPGSGVSSPVPGAGPTRSVQAPVTKPRPQGEEAQGGATVCGQCDRPIIGVFVRIKNKNLHADCFRCNTCGSSLKNVGYYNVSDKLYCDVHAKQAAKHNPPGPNLVPVTVKPGAAPPPGAVAAPKAPAPAPAPALNQTTALLTEAYDKLALQDQNLLEDQDDQSHLYTADQYQQQQQHYAEEFVEQQQVHHAHSEQQSFQQEEFHQELFQQENDSGFQDVSTGVSAGDISEKPAPVEAPAPPAPEEVVPAPASAPPQQQLPAAELATSLSPAPAPTPSQSSVAPGGSSANPAAFGAPSGGVNVRSHIPKKDRRVAGLSYGKEAPVCCECHSIIRGPFVTALGKNWCPDHFHCATDSCRKPLIDVGFVEEQGSLYCEDCYEKYLAPTCGKCDKRIKGDCLNAVGKQFHPECFCCTYCGKVFGSGAFYLEDGLPYCETDWNDLFTTKCVGCGFPIEAGDRWVEALNNNYHSQCFKCSKCHKNLEGQSFFAKGGKPFCKAHAQRGF